MKYLIFSPTSTQSIALARSIKLYDPEAIVYGGCLLDEESIKINKFYDYIVKINNKSKCASYDFIMPTTSYSTKIYATWMREFVVGRVYFSENSLKVSDKLWLYKEAKKCNISIPETWETFNEIPENAGNIFFKANNEGISNVRTWVRNKNKIPLRIRNASNFHFQERIHGKDVYGFSFIAQDGEIEVCYLHHEICSEPSDGGSAVILIRYTNPYLEEISKKLVKQIKYNGWGLVEWKYCNKRQDFVLMEINAKCWASIEFALRNEPKFLKLLFGINSKSENIDGIIWPFRLLSTIFLNGITAFKAIIKYKLVIGFEKLPILSILSTWLPILWKDRLRKLVYNILFCIPYIVSIQLL